MKNSKLSFILCLCLIHLTTTIESKEYSKEIIINSLNNYECSQIEEKYKINISITKKGFDTKEAKVTQKLNAKSLNLLLVMFLI